MIYSNARSILICQAKFLKNILDSINIEYISHTQKKKFFKSCLKWLFNSIIFNHKTKGNFELSLTDRSRNITQSKEPRSLELKVGNKLQQKKKSEVESDHT